MVTVAGGNLRNEPQPYASFAIKIWTGQRITHSDKTRIKRGYNTWMKFPRSNKCNFKKGLSYTGTHTMIPRPAPQVQLQHRDIIGRALSSHDAVHVNDP